MSSRRLSDLVWPTCTMPGCRHGRSWLTVADLHTAAEERPHWVDRNGRAVCSCHGARGTFACDEGAVES